MLLVSHFSPPPSPLIRQAWAPVVMGPMVRVGAVGQCVRAFVGLPHPPAPLHLCP